MRKGQSKFWVHLIVNAGFALGLMSLGSNLYAGKNYNWNGNGSSDNWSESGPDNWDWAPGSRNNPGSYSVDGSSYNAIINSSTFGASTTHSYSINQLGIRGGATLTMSDKILNVTSGDGVIAAREGGDIFFYGGTVNSKNLSVLDDGSTITIEGATVIITGTVAIGADPSDPAGAGTGGSPTIIVGDGGSLTCNEIIFDDEEGDTPKLIIQGNGIVNVTNDIITTDGGNDSDPLIEGIGNISISDSGQLNIGGDLIFDNKGEVGTYGNDIITMTGGTLSVGGDWINAGTNNITGGTVLLDGLMAQEIGSTTSASGASFYNLEIDNLLGVTTNQDLSIGQDLTLTAGVLNLSDYWLKMTNGSTGSINKVLGSIYSATTNISWEVGENTGSYNFALSASDNSSIPFIFNITSPGVGASGTVSLTTYPTGTDNTPYPAGVTNVNRRGPPPDNEDIDNSENTVDRFWVVTLSGFSANPTATVTFTASSVEVGSISGLKAQRWDGTTWEKPAPGQTSGANSVTVVGLSSFSPWAMSGNSKALPVEFLFFEAAVYHDYVQLDWATATETDNEKFVVEKSLDGFIFTQIGEVQGNGDVNERMDYTFDDTDISLDTSETLFYRLKQIDFDGVFDYSRTVRVVHTVEKPSLSVIPNPYQTEFELKFTSSEAGQAVVRVLDLKGRIFYSAGHSIARGPNRISISDLYNLSAGVYLVSLQGSQFAMSERIVKRD
ncbi:MAG: T9SS type A sorting domain-containing protein [Cyclobacteriaceae bacterium]